MYWIEYYPQLIVFPFPTADIEAIQLALRRGTERSGSTVAPILNQMQTKESPPTFFRYVFMFCSALKFKKVEFEEILLIFPKEKWQRCLNIISFGDF